MIDLNTFTERAFNLLSAARKHIHCDGVPAGDTGSMSHILALMGYLEWIGWNARDGDRYRITAAGRAWLEAQHEPSEVTP